MPSMIRKRGRASEIAYNIIGKPENLKAPVKTNQTRDDKFYRNARYSNVFTEIR
jgi:hypothetical protein